MTALYHLLLFFPKASIRRFCLLGRRDRYRLLQLGVASPFDIEKLIYSLLLSPCGGRSVLTTTFLCLSALCSTLEFSGSSVGSFCCSELIVSSLSVCSVSGEVLRFSFFFYIVCIRRSLRTDGVVVSGFFLCMIVLCNHA